MKKKILLRIAGILALAATQNAAFAAPAFPGAAGWGKNATGGRAANTKILFVTSLEDSGPGTLREALMQKGPRIILFKTGGVIDLKERISFSEGDVTIAGQTAPGDGIIVRNFPIRIGANNVIMRGVRIRNGDGPGPNGDLRDSVQISRVGKEQIHDVMVDHCSFGWSMDETAEFWYGARNITFSNCILSEALWFSQHPYTVKGSPYVAGKSGHGYAMLFGNGPNENITLYRNLFAHNERRNPWIKDNAKIEMINNVVYNWGSEATGLWYGPGEAKPCFGNIIGNYYKGGVDTAWQIQKGGRGISMPRVAAPGSKFYIQGNIGPGREKDEGDEWSAVSVGTFDLKPFRADAPVAELVSGITAQPATVAYETVLRNVGATPRDKADLRAVEDTRTGSGKHVDKLEEIGGYPAYATGVSPPDRDGDGMPDAWETARGLNPDDKSDAVKMTAAGYLHIEEYINSLLPER